jgi:hypothetical protein
MFAICSACRPTQNLEIVLESSFVAFLKGNEMQKLMAGFIVLAVCAGMTAVYAQTTDQSKTGQTQTTRQKVNQGVQKGMNATENALGDAFDWTKARAKWVADKSKSAYQDASKKVDDYKFQSPVVKKTPKKTDTSTTTN